MAYVAFVDNKPVASDNGNDVIDDIRENLMAMRDAVALLAMKGWNLSKSGGTDDQPAIYLLSKGTERLRSSLTWGSSGGSDGNVTQVVYAYSSDSGSNYDTIGTKSVSYTSDGYVSSTTWS